MQPPDVVAALQSIEVDPRGFGVDFGDGGFAGRRLGDDGQDPSAIRFKLPVFAATGAAV